MESGSAFLVSVQVGRPRSLKYEGRAWRSAIFKEPTTERVTLDLTNLTGDKQANLRFHGGPNKAVCCFAAEHYPYWREEQGFGERFAYGAFGENFTLSGMTEERVCIGDIYSVGTAKVQVSQPRQPCINMARKWDTPDMPNRMIEVGHTGYYFRVLEPGEVGAGDAITLLERLYPEITIDFANGAMYEKEGGAERNALLASLPELAEEWRRVFRGRFKKQAPAS